jgi:AraC-like DNA-binding protein
MTHLVGDVHGPSVAEWGFTRSDGPGALPAPWRSYRLPDEVGSGFYHLYAPTGDWSVAIHDFTLARDITIDRCLPEYLSLTWYESIAAEPLDGQARLESHQLDGFCSAADGWCARVHAATPVRSIGIEVTPEFCRDYVEFVFGPFAQVRDVFAAVHLPGAGFPELRALLIGLWEGRTRPPNPLLYQAAVLQAMGLLFDWTRRPAGQPSVRADDAARIREVMAFVAEQCDRPHSLDDLAGRACMGATKFKETFRAVAGTTLTQFVQERRIERATVLLRSGTLPIAQVARCVGYQCPSRFAELFRRSTGMSPSEFRSSAHRT